MTEAKKNDQGKPQLSLIPREGLELTAYALAYGADVYGRNNYKLGMEWSRLIDASLRHITAFAHGEDNDPDSGINHIGHAIASLSMLAFNMKHHKQNDNR